jgi:C4-dicarboxylate-specific signal transduction histidine kinase
VNRQWSLTIAFKIMLLIFMVAATVWVRHDLTTARREGAEARAAILAEVESRKQDHLRICSRLGRIEAKLDRLLQGDRR